MMSNSLTRVFKLSAVGAAMGLVVGCAAPAANGDLEARIQSAQDEASEAHALATEALEAANEAKEMANSAEGIAKAAQFTARRAAQRQERMVERGMYK